MSKKMEEIAARYKVYADMSHKELGYNIIDGWISVEDRMPVVSAHYHVSMKVGETEAAGTCHWCEEDGWTYVGRITAPAREMFTPPEVLYWQPPVRRVLQDYDEIKRHYLSKMQ